MHDLFTAEDRDRINAAMAAGSDVRYAALIAERPRAGTGLRVGLALGLAVAGAVIGLILVAIIGALGWVAAAVLAIAGLVLSQPLAGALHRRGLRSEAREAVVGGYATERGWRLVEELSLAASTPLLRAGDERSTGWGVEGALADGSAFAAGHYEYVDVRTVTDTDSDGTTRTRTERDTYPFAVAVVPAPGLDIPVLELSRGSTGGLGSRLSGALSDRRPVELESGEFNDAYRLMVGDDVDELVVRMRLSPVVQVALVERGAGDVRVEVEGDHLLVARSGRPDHADFGNLLDLVAEAVWVRALLAHDPPGRLPDPAPLRALVLGPQEPGA